MPRVIQVIESTICRGKGTETDPCRTVTRYHDLDGLFLAELDSERCPENWREHLEEDRKEKDE